MASSTIWSSMENYRVEFAAHGCCRIPNLLDEATLADCRKVFEETLERPSKVGPRMYAKDQQKGEKGGPVIFYNEATGHRATKEVYEDLLRRNPILAETVAQVWGSENVWFLEVEIFKKIGGKDDRKDTPFHQDTSGMPGVGLHIANLWIPLDDYTPKEHSLEIVRGSHKGPLYMVPGVGAVNGRDRDRRGNDKAAEPKPKPKTAAAPEKKVARNEPAKTRLPSMPDIRKEREKWDIASWDTKAGDVILLHSGSIHGGGPVGPAFPERNTLVLRFFGDDCWYKTLPRLAGAARHRGVEDGDHFSFSSKWLRVLGPGVPEGAKKSDGSVSAKL